MGEGRAGPGPLLGGGGGAGALDLGCHPAQGPPGSASPAAGRAASGSVRAPAPVAGSHNPMAG